MNYRETNERYIWEVQSRTRPKKWHRVDFAGFGGASQCSCEGWMFKASKNISRGLPWTTKLTTCEHSMFIRIMVLNKTSREIAKQDDGPK